jgi:hypothetical protein
MIYNYEEYVTRMQEIAKDFHEEIVFLPIFENVKKFMEGPVSIDTIDNQEVVDNNDDTISLTPMSKTYLAKSRQTNSLDEITSIIESNLDNEKFALYMVLKRPIINNNVLTTQSESYIIRYAD